MAISMKTKIIPLNNFVSMNIAIERFEIILTANTSWFCSMAIAICFWSNFDIFISNFCRYKTCKINSVCWFRCRILCSKTFIWRFFSWRCFPKIIREAGNRESLILRVKSLNIHRAIHHPAYKKYVLFCFVIICNL